MDEAEAAPRAMENLGDARPTAWLMINWSAMFLGVGLLAELLENDVSTGMCF